MENERACICSRQRWQGRNEKYREMAQTDPEIHPGVNWD